MTEPSIAVVGAGIVGCLVATELSFRAPERPIVVLDRDAVGCGASRRSAGLHFPRGAHRARAADDGLQPGLLRRAARDPAGAADAPPRHVVSWRERRALFGLGETYLASARLQRAGGVPDVVRLPRVTAAWRGDGCQHADVHALARSLASELPPTVSLREGVRVAGLELHAHARRVAAGHRRAHRGRAGRAGPGPLARRTRLAAPRRAARRPGEAGGRAPRRAAPGRRRSA